MTGAQRIARTSLFGAQLQPLVDEDGRSGLTGFDMPFACLHRLTIERCRQWALTGDGEGLAADEAQAVRQLAHREWTLEAQLEQEPQMAQHAGR